MTTYSSFKNKTSSEKVVLAWIEPSAKLSVWTLHSGSIYKKVVPEYVIRIYQNTTLLTEVNTLGAVTGVGKWFFDYSTKTVYVWCNSSSNPDAVLMRADYRLFFSNGPFVLPHDLSTGDEVEYLPHLESTSNFGYELDPEQMGISLEGQGDIKFFNNDGYFEDKFDKYFWENKEVTIYSWSPSILLSEKKKIYKGIITGKQYSPESVTFNLKDFIFNLNKNLQLNLFDGTEGDIQESNIGTFKRKVYGRVSGLRGVCTDCILDGFTLTGTISGSAGGTTLTGTGTAFLTECSPEDTIYHEDNSYKIKEVVSDTSIELTSDLDFAISAETLNLKPKINYRHKNRDWFLADHALKKMRATITMLVSATRLTVDSTINFNAGDIVLINSVKNTIRRISGNTIQFEQALDPYPIVGDYVDLYPVQGCNVGTTDFVFIRDFTIDNQTTGCTLNLDPLAEFNVTIEQNFIGTATFTNGSRTITGSGTAFLNDFKIRDWIKPTGTTNWVEILEITSDTAMKVRTNYPGSTVSSSGQKKNVTYLNDDSLLTVNCFGKTEDGTDTGVWIKTCPEVVNDLLAQVGLDGDVSATSLTKAIEEAPWIASLKLPIEFGSKNLISIKDAIDYMNQSVIGSLHYNSDFEIEINVINSKKPTDILKIDDSDIISWEVRTRSDHIVREFISQYKHEDIGRYSGKESSSYKSKVNTLADKFLDSERTSTTNLYLYEEDAAETINQRLAFYHDYSSNRLIITTKLNLSEKNLGDKIYVVLDRLFHRLGSDAYGGKIGIINAIRKDGMNTIVELEDYSNIWNRIANFADGSSAVFSGADDTERIKNGYFLNDYEVITSYDYTYSSNRFG